MEQIGSKPRNETEVEIGTSRIISPEQREEVAEWMQRLGIKEQEIVQWQFDPNAFMQGYGFSGEIEGMIRNLQKEINNSDDLGKTSSFRLRVTEAEGEDDWELTVKKENEGGAREYSINNGGLWRGPNDEREEKNGTDFYQMLSGIEGRIIQSVITKTRYSFSPQQIDFHTEQKIKSVDLDLVTTSDDRCALLRVELEFEGSNERDSFQDSREDIENIIQIIRKETGINLPKTGLTMRFDDTNHRIKDFMSGFLKKHPQFLRRLLRYRCILPYIMTPGQQAFAKAQYDPEGQKATPAKYFLNRTGCSR